MMKIMQECSQLPSVEAKLLLQNKKLKNLKTRISKLNAQKLNISPTKTILNSAENMNNVQCEKYDLRLEEIEKKNCYLVKDLEHFLVFIGQKNQNLLMVDLIDMIIRNTRQKEEN